uniref:Odorant receptor n=1 Tax=Apolygus lucorum TaxID=248454 RepID=A0A0U2EYW2_APOLU|nr:olfactory receptor 28 [Apolygus lucorum]
MAGYGRLEDGDIVDGLSIWYLKASGLWEMFNHHRETGGRSKVLKFWMAGMIIAYSPVFVVSVVGPFFAEKDLEGMSLVVLNPMSTVQMVVKFGILWFHMEKQSRLLDLMKKNFLACVPPDKEAEVSRILGDAVKEANIYTFFGTRINIITVLLWSILPVLRSEYFRITLGITIFGTPLRHNKLLGFSYPFDYDASPGNEIVFVYEFLLVLSAGLIITVMECLVAQLVVLLTAYLKVFQYFMEELKSTHDPKFDKEQLLLYVKEHQKLMRVGDEVCDLYNFLITVQLSTGLFILIIAIFNFFLSSGNGDVVVMIKFVVYTLYTLVEICVYCYAGSNLETTSEDVCFAAYSCEWYEMNPDFRKTLQMMMVRSRSPVVLKAGKLYPLNLITLTNIVQMAYSTSMLMYQQTHN